jgi:isorenieratene synthase
MANFIQRFVQKKLGSFKQELNNVDHTKPFRLEKTKSVAVIGAGLAGIAAAAKLAERGFAVTIYEKESYIGGKVGSWKHNEKNVEHGFHAFFKQYYNLRNFLKEIDAYKHLMPISDYKIKFINGSFQSFADLPKTPIANILAMRKMGFYTFSEMMRNPKNIELMALLSYDPKRSFEKYDNVSFQQFADRVNLPKKMRVVFNTFARAFFAEPDQISMAELIKGMHFYFLSNDGGLLYDVLDDDFEHSLLAPIRKYLNTFNVELKLSTAVSSLERSKGGFLINSDEYDYCILASNESASVKLLEQSQSLASLEKTKLNSFKPNNYAVLRLWMDKEIGSDEPFFVFTDREELLDSITFYHHMEKESRLWADKNGAGIYELHAYSVPSKFSDKNSVREQMLIEFFKFYPELKDAKIMDEYFQFRNDFTSFHTNDHALRPQIKTRTRGFYLAGDWVKISSPAMLMEAAYTSGVLAANEILTLNDLKENQLYTVPKKGIFA